MIWDVTKQDTLTGYGELGQQYMHFDAYSEDTNNNPFPASVGEGLSRMGIARAGTLWTHKFDELYDFIKDRFQLEMPVSVTLAGAVARSFDVHSGLTATVSGLGSFPGSNDTDIWGEFGARIETQITKEFALDLNLNGTTGGGALGTSVHGGAGVSYKF